ncbi:MULTISPECIES: SH3 domain-containing protein [Actibacterium]|uniref:Uncharacterized protein YgiM (DUF1202 family) n=1 Tax=Actibacterium naphthalenivorans TaxID=1614693 RepID=A0A840C896_9RHOB|nr:MULTISPECIES: SH3 domain-containing protein [Actibacterium]MBB4021290.1 uncharacterized protein YgiM (DUF1202 family) [Actibacterium naphthalenivorans]
MFRLIFWTCAALYAVLTLYGEPAPVMSAARFVTSAEEATAEPAPAAAPAKARAPAPALPPEDAGGIKVTPVSFGSGSAPALRTIDKRDAPAGYTPAEPRQTAAPATPGGTVYTVTGSRVNLRAGPSTGAEVITALTRGTRATLVSAPTDGWVELQVQATGLRGFMAERFLAPEG